VATALNAIAKFKNNVGVMNNANPDKKQSIIDIGALRKMRDEQNPTIVSEKSP